MKRLLFLLAFIPFFCSAQIYDHHRVFTDSIQHKDFSQGALDAKVYFRGTGDYFIGLASAPAYFIPAAICYAIPPKDRRFINYQNPNNEYLYSNADYYNGYKYGAKKKKRKRLVQGALTPVGITVGILVVILSSLSN
jgi:hypothetical protein